MSFLKLLEVTATECRRFFIIIMYFCSCSQWFGWVLVYLLLAMWLFFVTVVLVFDYYFCRWTYMSRASS
jgi:hypothetical protein